MKREYETTFIFNARLTPEKIDSKLTEIKKIIEDNDGEVRSISRKGKRRLAYEINKNQYGYYTCYRFTIEGEKIKELERLYSLTESIIRFLNVCVPKGALIEEEQKKKSVGFDETETIKKFALDDSKEGN